MSAESSLEEGAEQVGALRVSAHFKISDEQTAQTVAAKLVDRAHEIANMPECECDVDVSVEWAPPDSPPVPVELAGNPARGHIADR